MLEVTKQDNNLPTTQIPSVSPDGSGFHRYLQEINKIPSLTADEELDLAKRYVNEQDLAAAHKLVTSHLKLVAKIAISYRGYGLPTVEMISEGNIGLMHAVKKFNPDLGYRLSTYAMWWIKASIQEYILRSWSMVKIGTTSAQKKLFFSLGKIKAKIRNSYNRNMTHEDYKQVAQDLGVNERDVQDIEMRLSSSDASLNMQVGPESETEMIDFLPENSPNQEVIVADQQDTAIKHRMLTEALQILNERELDIFTSRKLTDKPSTLDDLSHKYDISKERVRQIENRAFEKILQHITLAAQKINLQPGD